MNVQAFSRLFEVTFKAIIASSSGYPISMSIFRALGSALNSSTYTTYLCAGATRIGWRTCGRIFCWGLAPIDWLEETGFEWGYSSSTGSGPNMISSWASVVLTTCWIAASKSFLKYFKALLHLCSGNPISTIFIMCSASTITWGLFYELVCLFESRDPNRAWAKALACESLLGLDCRATIGRSRAGNPVNKLLSLSSCLRSSRRAECSPSPKS